MQKQQFEKRQREIEEINKWKEAEKLKEKIEQKKDFQNLNEQRKIREIQLKREIEDYNSKIKDISYSGLSPAEKIERSEAITQKWIEKYTPYRKEGSNWNPKKWGYAIVDTPFAFGRYIPAQIESGYRIINAGRKKPIQTIKKFEWKKGAEEGIKGTYEMAKNPGNWPMLVYSYQGSAPKIKAYQERVSTSRLGQQIKASAKEFDPRGKPVRDAWEYNKAMAKRVPSALKQGIVVFGKSAISPVTGKAIKYNIRMMKATPKALTKGIKEFGKSTISKNTRIAYNKSRLKYKESKIQLKEGVKEFGKSAISDNIKSDIALMRRKGTEYLAKEAKRKEAYNKYMQLISQTRASDLTFKIKNQISKTKMNPESIKIGDTTYIIKPRMFRKALVEKEVNFKPIEITKGLKKRIREMKKRRKEFRKSLREKEKNNAIEKALKKYTSKNQEKTTPLSLEEKQAAWKKIAQIDEDRFKDFRNAVLDKNRFGKIRTVNIDNKFSKLGRFFKDKAKEQKRILKQIRELEKSSLDRRTKQQIMNSIKDKYERMAKKSPSISDFENKKKYYKYIRDVQKGREVPHKQWQELVNEAQKQAIQKQNKVFQDSVRQTIKKRVEKRKKQTEYKEIQGEEGQVLLQKVEKKQRINPLRKKLKQKFQQKMKEVELQTVIKKNRLKLESGLLQKTKQKQKQKQKQSQKQVQKQKQKQKQKQEQSQKQIQKQEYKYEYITPQITEQNYKWPPPPTTQTPIQITEEIEPIIPRIKYPPSKPPKYPGKPGNEEEQKYKAYKVNYTKNGNEKTYNTYRTLEDAEKATKDLKKQGIKTYRIIPILQSKQIGIGYRKEKNLYAYKTKKSLQKKGNEGFLMNALKQFN